jgi:hypothetical protein
MQQSSKSGVKNGNSQDTLHRNELGSAIKLKNLQSLREQKTGNRIEFWGPQRGDIQMLAATTVVGMLFVGMLLGLRFKVFVLVPFLLIIVCAIIATDHGLKAITLAILASAVLLQIGYMLGLSVRVQAGRYPRRRQMARYQPSKPKPVSL